MQMRQNAAAYAIEIGPNLSNPMPVGSFEPAGEEPLQSLIQISRLVSTLREQTAPQMRLQLE